MFMAQAAATRRCRTAITWIIASLDIFIILTAITATTTVHWRLSNGKVIAVFRSVASDPKK
jgi:hypothetical protein